MGVLELLDEEDIKERRIHKQLLNRLSTSCGGCDTLASRAQDFAAKAGFISDGTQMELFIALLADIRGIAKSAELPSQETRRQEKIIDTNICCFSTGKLYTESLLGIGVSRERRNLGTAAELLSKEAFDGGLRQSTNKAPFEYFLPMWINETHSVKSKEWRQTLRQSYLEIGHKVFEARGEDDAIMEVFPRLINQMIVEVMRPDAAKCAAIATFEALCNFWRTLRWLVDSRPSLQKQIRTALSRFATQEAFRHKDQTPDLGMILVLFTVFQDHEGCPTRNEFINSYADENSLRWVMWWQRSGIKPESRPVFEATKVSREICMFQMMIVDVVLGEVGPTLSEMEATNCKLPKRLESLQVQWRERKASTSSWSVYFKHIGASRPALGSDEAWIEECVRRAAEKGPKYAGNAKGSSKGKGKSSGKGRAF